MSLPLGLALHDHGTLIGMVVLAMDEPGVPTARRLRLLEAVAQGLYEAGDVCAAV